MGRHVSHRSQHSIPDPGSLPDAPVTVVGVNTGQQTDANQPDPIRVFATTVNAVAVTRDTGYSPSAQRGVHVDALYSAEDVANARVRTGNGEGALRTDNTNPTPNLTVAGQTFGGSIGDAALAGLVPSFAVSGTQTLTVTFTPPNGYVGTIRWSMLITPDEN